MEHSRRAASGVAIDRDVIRVLVSTSEGIAASADALLANDQAVAASLVASEDRVSALAWESALGCASGARAGAPPEPAPEARWSGIAVALLADAAAANRQVAAIAGAALAGLGPELNPRERGLVQRLAELAGTAWQLLPDAYAERGRAGGTEVERAIPAGLEAAWVRVRRELGREPGAALDGFCQMVRAYTALADLGLGVASRLRALAAALDGDLRAPAAPVAISWQPPAPRVAPDSEPTGGAERAEPADRTERADLAHPGELADATSAAGRTGPTGAGEPTEAVARPAQPVAEVVTWEASEAPRRAG